MTPRPTFQGPYDEYRERHGEPFDVLAEIPDPTGEIGPMYRIRFPDGAEIVAWPEEVDASLTIYGEEIVPMT